ncbi:MAG: hypothetical protein Q7S40_01670 [Opitutaceae bacterium]|nr:hypothetical protein [Opitutaceae bacterium]
MPLSVPRPYAELLRQVQATLFAGQRDIEIAWVRTYHETGRLIHCHVPEHDRADTGAAPRIRAQQPRALTKTPSVSHRFSYVKSS